MEPAYVISCATNVYSIADITQIISFLGAIHWGLEWAKYGGVHGYPRYAIGVVAPMAGWSATVMPVEYALITQFLSFVGLYFVDTRAALKGWTPPWCKYAPSNAFNLRLLTPLLSQTESTGSF
jgi:hypothetical protein